MAINIGEENASPTDQQLTQDDIDAIITTATAKLPGEHPAEVTGQGACPVQVAGHPPTRWVKRTGVGGGPEQVQFVTDLVGDLEDVAVGLPSSPRGTWWARRSQGIALGDRQEPVPLDEHTGAQGAGAVGGPGPERGATHDPATDQAAGVALEHQVHPGARCGHRLVPRCHGAVTGPVSATRVTACHTAEPSGCRGRDPTPGHPSPYVQCARPGTPETPMASAIGPFVGTVWAVSSESDPGPAPTTPRRGGGGGDRAAARGASRLRARLAYLIPALERQGLLAHHLGRHQRGGASTRPCGAPACTWGRTAAQRRRRGAAVDER